MEFHWDSGRFLKDSLLIILLLQGVYFLEKKKRKENLEFSGILLGVEEFLKKSGSVYFLEKNGKSGILMEFYWDSGSFLKISLFDDFALIL